MLQVRIVLCSSLHCAMLRAARCVPLTRVQVQVQTTDPALADDGPADGPLFRSMASVLFRSRTRRRGELDAAGGWLCGALLARLGHL